MPRQSYLGYINPPSLLSSSTTSPRLTCARASRPQQRILCYHDFSTALSQIPTEWNFLALSHVPVRSENGIPEADATIAPSAEPDTPIVPKGFLDLPGEIRIIIYQLTARSIIEKSTTPEDYSHTHVTQRRRTRRQERKNRKSHPYLGFYWCCRQVKKELDYELQKSIEKKFTTMVSKMEKDPQITGLTLEVPLHSPLSPILRIPSQFFDADRYISPINSEYWYKAPINLQGLLKLNFKTVILAPLEYKASLSLKILDRWSRWRRFVSVMAYQRWDNQFNNKEAIVPKWGIDFYSPHGQCFQSGPVEYEE